MRLPTIAVMGVALAGCSFSGPPGIAGGDGDGDAGVDAPPLSADVRFTSVTADVTEIRPGLYGFEVTAVLENALDVEITGVGVTLDVRDDTSDRAGDFFWREPDLREGATAPQPDSIAAGSSQSYTFVVDALASAVPPGPIEINGAATFDAGGAALSATPATTPVSLPFIGLPPPIVVNNLTDESNGDNNLCLREALLAANGNPGLDRIVFDPQIVSAGTAVPIDNALGPLPPISEDLVIDGTDTGPVLTFDAAWNGSNNYGIRVSAGTAVISGLTFRDMGYAYQDEDIAGTGNCGPSNQQFEGGAIRVDSGTLILDDNDFADPGVPERNCFAATVRLEGGSGHRILRNRFTATSMDAVFVDAATIEIVDNDVDSTPDSGKSDECFFVESQGGQDLLIAGNLCVDQEFSAVIAGGTDAGELRVIHNTFVRTGLVSLAAVRRFGATRPITLRDNIYINNAESVGADDDGSNFDIGFEASTDASLCGSCGSATVDVNSLITAVDLGLSNGAGTSRSDLAPALGSPLLNSGRALLDRNGKSPGWFGGTGPERGAVER